MLSWLDLGMTWSFVQCAGNGGAMILLASGKIHPTKSRFALAMRILHGYAPVVQCLVMCRNRHHMHLNKLVCQ